MPEPTRTHIAIEALDAPSWERLAAKLPWREGQPLYAYEESVSACILEQTTPEGATPAADAWEGRLFDEAIEVRWRRRDEGGFDAWVVREVEGGGRAVVARLQPYYLIGEFDEYEPRTKTATFVEGRYADVAFRYPVPRRPTSDERRRGRAYVEVVEYAPAPPGTWSGRAPDEIEAWLNEPRIVAHRFCGVGVGRDE